MVVSKIAQHGLSDAEHRRLTTWSPEIATALRPGVPITACGDEIRIGNKGSLALYPDGGWSDYEAAFGGFGASSLIVHLGSFSASEARKFSQTWLRDHPGTGRFSIDGICEAKAQASAQRNADWARQVTERAQPLHGTSSAIYLAQRGLVEPYPAGLLAHLTNARLDESALVARLTRPDGTVIGVQLGYLDPHGRKSALLPQRRLFWIEPDREKHREGLFRIPPSAVTVDADNGSDQTEALAATTLICEGVENGLALHMAFPRATVLGIPGIGWLRFIAPINGDVVVVRDGDPPDAPASMSLTRGIDHLLRKAPKVSITTTPDDEDANSLLLSGGIEALRALVLAAEPAQLSPDREIQWLASLGNLDYENERAAAAKRLNARRIKLDEAVGAKREQLAKESFDEDETQVRLGPEPWHEPVTNIAAVLSQASDELAKYVVATREQRDTAVLWALHTFFVHHEFVYLAISPRLAIQAAAPMCGKTLLLELLDHLVCRPLLAASLTPAVVYRTIDAFQPCLLIDEADKFMRSNRNPELVGILNASHHRRTATVPRSVPCPDGSWEIRLFSAWCTYAFTGVGRLEDQSQSRCISIVLKRALPDELGALSTVEDGVSQVLLDCGRKFARWAQDQRALPETKVPGEILYRDRDNWRPLLRIAQLVGDEWLDRAVAAAAFANGATRSVGAIVPLLADIREVFGGRERITTDALLAGMLALPEPSVDWTTAYKGRPINAYYLRSQLKDVINAPEHERKWRERNGKVQVDCRGYLKKHFKDAFDRYLPPSAGSENLPDGAASRSSTPDNHDEQAPGARKDFCKSPPNSSATSAPFDTATNNPPNTLRKMAAADDSEVSAAERPLSAPDRRQCTGSDEGADREPPAADAPLSSATPTFQNENNGIFVAMPDAADAADQIGASAETSSAQPPATPPLQLKVENLPVRPDEPETEFWLHPDAERSP
jgi:putative DNA primase/helicase